MYSVLLTMTLMTGMESPDQRAVRYAGCQGGQTYMAYPIANYPRGSNGMLKMVGIPVSYGCSGGVAGAVSMGCTGGFGGFRAARQARLAERHAARANGLARPLWLAQTDDPVVIKRATPVVQVQPVAVRAPVVIAPPQSTAVFVPNRTFATPVRSILCPNGRCPTNGTVIW